MNGTADDFWLCPTGGPTAQVNIVYKPTADNYGEYEFEACYNVRLYMLGLD